MRLAGIATVEGANVFLRERYIGKFNARFSIPATEKGTAFRRTGRNDLNWIFAVQTERAVGRTTPWPSGTGRGRSTRPDSGIRWRGYGDDPRTPG